MNAQQRTILRMIDEQLIGVHNSLNEGKFLMASTHLIGGNLIFDKVLQGLKSKAIEASEDFLSELETRQQEWQEYAKQLKAWKEQHPEQFEEKEGEKEEGQKEDDLFEVVVRNRGFTVYLSQEEAQALRSRLSQLPWTYAVENITKSGVSYDQFMAELEGGEAKALYLEPTATPYLVIITENSKWFGLVEGKRVGKFVWMTMNEADLLDTYLSKHYPDHQIVEERPNITKEKLNSMVDEL